MWCCRCCRALPTTERLVDEAFLVHLKPSAVFVNVGRGKTVDEDALVDALKTGRVRAAALRCDLCRAIAGGVPAMGLP
jgi:lactate dehydrogenase-like 2-hydroxyacid dehydrogenase